MVLGTGATGFVDGAGLDLMPQILLLGLGYVEDPGA
jgi:hypothetical protein